MSDNFQESCTCGAVFITSKYKHLKKWRVQHKENHPKEIQDKNGAESTTQVSTQWDYDNNTQYTAKIGFTMNEEKK